MNRMTNALAALLASAVMSSSQAAPSTAETPSFEPVYVTYEITVEQAGRSAVSSFVYARSSDQVMFQDKRKPYRDIWKRVGPAETDKHMLRLVESAHSAIEISRSELALRGYMPTWDALMSPFGGGLAARCSDPAAGMTCSDTTLTPERVEVRMAGLTIIWKRTSFSQDLGTIEAALRIPGDLAVWDAADFGDQEYDKDLQKLLAIADMDPHGGPARRDHSGHDHSSTPHRH